LATLVSTAMPKMSAAVRFTLTSVKSALRRIGAACSGLMQMCPQHCYAICMLRVCYGVLCTDPLQFSYSPTMRPRIESAMKRNYQVPSSDTTGHECGTQHAGVQHGIPTKTSP
jgi:hypothetical protein